MDTKNNSLNTNKEFEVIHLAKTKKVCSLCEDFAGEKSKQNDLITIMSCEGACLRGEVSRRVANKLAFEELPGNTARLCLGGAFTKDTGQRNMARSAKRLIALEGCLIECATRMMKGVIPELEPEVIFVDKYYKFDTNLFAINDVSEEELEKFSDEAVKNIKALVMKQ